MSDPLGNVGSVGIGVTVDNTDAKTKLQETGRYVDNYLKKLQQQASNIGKSSRELQLMALAQRGATAEQLKAADAALRTVEAYREQQRAAKAAADEATRTAASTARAQAAAQALANRRLSPFQAQQLSFQLNDLFVQIASGQNPLTALIQQGSQLSGTFGGLRGTLQALASVFTATRVAIGGIVAVLGTLGFAYYTAKERAQEFSDAMVKSGNFAGQTRGQFDQLVRSVAASSAQTVGNVREVAQALVATGQIGPEAFAKATAAAAAYAALTGETADKVGAAFADMADDPAKAAAKIDKSMNLLSAAQMKAIEDFTRTGEKAAALGILYDALVQRGDKLRDNLGGLSAALRDTKNWFSQLWEAAVSGIGPQSIDQQIETITKRIRAAQQREQLRGTGLGVPNAFEAGGAPPQSAAELMAQREELIRQRTDEQRAAADRAEQARVQRAGKDANKVIETYLQRAKAATLYKDKLKELEKSFKDAEAAGTPVSKADQALARRELKKEFTPKGDRSAVEEQKAALALRIEQIKNETEATVRAFSRQETVLEAQRSAGLVAEKAFYDEKRRLIEAEAQARVEGLQKEKAALEAQKFTGKDKLENDRKIADVTAKIAETQADAATKITVTTIQQKAATDALAASYVEAQQAAQSFFDAQNRAQAREVAAVGLGDEARNRIAARAQIEDRYEQQRRDLANQRQLLEALGRFNADERQKYQERLAVINDFQGKALASFDEYYKRLREQEGNAANGVTRAFDNYIDAAANLAKRTEDLLTNSFSAVEDAMVKLATTGKLSFKDLFSSIAAEITKFAARSVMGDLLTQARSALTSGGPGLLGSLGNALGLNASPLPALDYRNGADIASDAATAASKGAAETAGASAAATALTTAGASVAAELTTAGASVAAELATAGGTFTAELLTAGTTFAAEIAAAGTAFAATVSAAGAAGGAEGIVGAVLGGGRAIGGPVAAGGLYPVNERGPELLTVAGKQYLMVGAQGGEVKPLREGEASVTPATSINVYVTPPPGSSRQTAMQWGADAGRHIQNSMRRNLGK